MLTFAATVALAAPGHHGHHGHHGHRGPPPPPPASATVQVDNHYAAPVDFLVDGRMVGRVTPGAHVSFAVNPGRHDLEVRTLQGVVLQRDREFLSPREVERLFVRTPYTQLTVTNRGSLPLFVAGAGAGLWIAPHATATTTVPAGPVDLVASVQGYRGLRTVDQLHVFAEPGFPNAATVGFAPNRYARPTGRRVSYRY